jgi:outer membrane protein W
VALAAAFAVPIQAQTPPDPCKGRLVRRLAGPHAMTKQPIRDLADLQRRLPEFEAGFRDVIARDASLGPAVADALVAAIKSGSGVTDGKLGPRDNFRWMAYKPQGVVGVIQPPCAQLRRDYDAFDITVEVAPAAATPVQDARCELGVTRNCERENPTITLDASGSSANVRVERAGQAVPGAGPRWTVPDTVPYSEDVSFVVRAQGSAAAAQTAKVHHFRIPKICGNLTYLGESPGRAVGAAATAATCEKTITSPMCKPWAEVSVEPPTVEVHHEAIIRTAGGYHDGLAKLEISCSDQPEPEVIDNPQREHPYTPGRVCCDEGGFQIRFETKNAAGDMAEATTALDVTPHDWVFRPSLTYIMPTDAEQERDTVRDGLPAHEVFEIDGGFGVGLSLERRFNERIGLEFGAIFGSAEAEWELTIGGQTGEYDLSPKFYAFTVGPNFHLLGCGAADLYLGPLVGYGGLYDPNFWVFGHRFHADFSGDFIWGAQLGLDVPFRRDSDWALHTGVKYLVLDQETDAGTIDVDPLIFELGLAYHF